MMLRITLFLSLCSLGASAADPKTVDISEHDALTLRTLQLKAQGAQSAYDKVLALPQIAQVREAVTKANQDLQKAAEEIAEKTCGKGATIREEPQKDGAAKLVCSSAPAAKAPEAKK